MATKNIILGTVPKSRGRYTEGDITTKWYYDNILEYKGSSFRCISEASTGITGAPATYNANTHTLVPNAGWEFFVDTTGALDVEERLTENGEKLSELETGVQSIVGFSKNINLDEQYVRVDIVIKTGTKYYIESIDADAVLYEWDGENIGSSFRITPNSTFERVAERNIVGFRQSYGEGKTIKVVLYGQLEIIEDAVKNINESAKGEEKSIKALNDEVFGTKGFIKTYANDFVSGYLHNVNVGDIIPESPTASTSIKHLLLEVQEGDRYIITADARYLINTRAYSFADKDKKITYTADANSNLIDYEITIPEGVKYLLVESQDVSGYVEQKKISSLREEIDKSIKILCFGNSFTEDSMGYVPFILENICPNVNVTIGIAFISGSPLTQHCAYLTNTTRTDRFNTYSVEDGVYKKDGSVVNYVYHKSTNGSNWSSVSGKTIDQMLNDEEWDVITFQQAGTPSDGTWDEWYAPYIYDIQKAIFNKIGHNVKLGWLSVHGAYESTNEGFLNHWNSTAQNSKKIMEKTAASVLFPYGTAVQNLRSTSLINLGNGSAHNLTYDNAHLQEGIGCLTAAYTNALVIAKLVGTNYVGVVGESTRPDVQYVEDHNVPSPHWLVNDVKTVLGITDTNTFLAQIAAEKAVMNPYEVIDLSVFE